jgi:hypothetical protein
MLIVQHHHEAGYIQPLLQSRDVFPLFPLVRRDPPECPIIARRVPDWADHEDPGFVLPRRLKELSHLTGRRGIAPFLCRTRLSLEHMLLRLPCDLRILMCQI